MAIFYHPAHGLRNSYGGDKYPGCQPFRRPRPTAAPPSAWRAGRARTSLHRAVSPLLRLKRTTCAPRPWTGWCRGRWGGASPSVSTAPGSHPGRRSEVTRFDHDSHPARPLRRPARRPKVERTTAVRLHGRGAVSSTARPGACSRSTRRSIRHLRSPRRPALRWQQCRRLARKRRCVSQLEQENRALRLHATTPAGAAGRARRARRPDAREIVGQEPGMTRLLHEMQVVASLDLPVLLLGRNRRGQGAVARLLHRHSPRRHKPLVHVNCAALPESLAESELFGHRRGAFSGAVSDRPAASEAADGGTLFLDEVGELPLTVQAKLLRTLQNGEIQRLGADEPARERTRDRRHQPQPARPGGQWLCSAPTCTTACRSTRCRYRRCASAATTCCCWRALSRTQPHAAGHSQPAPVGQRTGRPAPLPLAGQHPRAGACHQPRRASGPEPRRATATPSSRSKRLCWILTRWAHPHPRHWRHPHPQRCSRHCRTMPPCPSTLRAAVDESPAPVHPGRASHGGNWASAARELDIDASNLHKLARACAEGLATKT